MSGGHKIIMGSNPGCKLCGSKKHLYWFPDYGYLCRDCCDEDWA